MTRISTHPLPRWTAVPPAASRNSLSGCMCMGNAPIARIMSCPAAMVPCARVTSGRWIWMRSCFERRPAVFSAACLGACQTGCRLYNRGIKTKLSGRRSSSWTQQSVLFLSSGFRSHSVLRCGRSAKCRSAPTDYGFTDLMFLR